jgi:YegS/Rv2252/BmrU family lipid kinase
MKKVRFIVNPNSGTKKKAKLPSLIKATLDKNKFDYEICFTKAAGHATELSREAANNKFDIVVAVGGDGSVNETAAALVNSETSLAIIPTGSGNGLARHLNIPIHLRKAIEVLNSGKVESIDSLNISGRFCLATMGVGFDGHIAHLFARAKKRGFVTYIKLVLKEFATYKDRRFDFLVDGVLYQKECFILTFANCSQFGNDAVIAPSANLTDGIIDVSIIRRFPVSSAPLLLYQLMRKSIDHSKYFQSLRGKEILLKNNEKLNGHIDGESVIFESDLKISILPQSIKVIVPDA